MPGRRCNQAVVLRSEKPYSCATLLLSMDHITRLVSLAVGRASTAGCAVSLAQVRRALEEDLGRETDALSDDALQRAMLNVSGYAHASLVVHDGGGSVTCTPLPVGWIPRESSLPGRW